MQLSARGFRSNYALLHSPITHVCETEETDALFNEATRMRGVQKGQKYIDVGRTRTYAPEGN